MPNDSPSMSALMAAGKRRRPRSQPIPKACAPALNSSGPAGWMEGTRRCTWMVAPERSVHQVVVSFVGLVVLVLT